MADLHHIHQSSFAAMNKVFLLLTGFLMSFINCADAPVDKIGIAGPLVFNNVNYDLVWSERPNEFYYVQEYLPKGEQLEQFNQMLTVNLFNRDVSPKVGVQQKVRELEQRKQSNPTCNYAVNESSDGKELMVDFILSESQNNVLSIVEFNVYKYKQVDLGRKQKGLLVYAYSKRSYGDAIPGFLAQLKEERANLLNTMIGAELPVVQLKTK